jgi:hypothetical protein
MPDEGTAQEDSVWIFQDRQRPLLEAGLTIVARDQYASIEKSPNDPARH